MKKCLLKESKEMVGYIGFLMLVIGASGIEGNDMLISGIITLIGLSLLVITAIKENSPAQKADQSTVQD